jgi:hypothetical protein
MFLTQCGAEIGLSALKIYFMFLPQCGAEVGLSVLKI